MTLTTTNNTLSMMVGGRNIFPTGEAILSVINSKLSFTSSHGNFKVKEKIVSRDAMRLDSVSSDGNSAIFVFKDKRIEMKVEQVSGGVRLTFTANADFPVELCLAADANEGIFGGGEQFRQLDMKGDLIPNFVSEHIVIPPIVQKLLFKGWYREKKHSYIETYAPMTTYTSSNKYAIRFDTTAYGVADFKHKTRSTFRFYDCPRSMLYVCGDSYSEVSRHLNEDIPNREQLPDWCFDGMILGVQGGIERVEGKVEELTAKGAKVCAVWCQDWSGKKVTAVGKQVYWNWSQDETLYPDLASRIATLKTKGVRFLAYINPYLVKDGVIYDYCKEQGWLITRSNGEIYHVKSTTFDAGMMDLTHPGMVEYLQETLIRRNMLDLGIDGYMADFGEYLPVDCVLHDGNPTLLHNAWPTLWAKLNREAVEAHPRADEIMFFTRSAYNGAQNATYIMWNGDQHTDFTKDYGMACVMPATFNLGFSGMAAVHSDIGGFISFASLVRDKELFIRWMEMNAFSPLMRSHETIRPESNAQPYDEEIIEHTAELSSLHVALKPYLVRCMAKANEGIPVMRPDFYDTGDYASHRDPYAYLLGDEIYVCPIVTRHARHRKVCLPEGNWIRFFEGSTYEGNKDYEVEAPLGVPVAFYRADGAFKELFDSLRIKQQ